MNRTKNMTQGNPTKLIFSFALPLILGNLGQQLYMITDAAIVGRGVGVSALASLGATDWIYWLILWAVQAATQGFAILITQNFGLGDSKSIKKSITMSAILCGVIGILFTAAGLFIAEPLLTLMQTPDDIFQGALSYVTTMYAGTIIVIAYNMASAILRSFGDGKSPLVAMIIAAAVNICLDLLFVMVFKWGIVGAAAATLIAQLVSFLYCLLMIRKIPAVQMEREDWKIDTAVIKKLLKLGMPLALQHVVITIGGIILQFVINGYGSLFIAGFTATNKLYGLLESSAISFGFATSTYMAQNWGANLIERIEKGMKSAVKLSVVCSVGISIMMIFLGKYILRLFVSGKDVNASQVIDIAYWYLFVMSITLIFLYLLHTYRSALQGLGNTIAPMISGFLEFIARVSVALFLPLAIGEYGVFFAESAAWFICVSYLIFTYYRNIRKIKCGGLTFSGLTQSEF